MKLKELIVKSYPQETACIYTIGEYFDLSPYCEGQIDLESCWIQKWYCTDTWVGIKAYFLRKKFVGISFQSARKSDIHYYWKDQSSANQVENYIKSLCQIEEKEFEVLTEEFLEEEMGETFQLEWAGQLIHKTVFYGDPVKGGKIATVIGRASNNILEKKIKIRCDDEERVVEMSEIFIPYN